MAEQPETTTPANRDRLIRRHFISECRDSRIVVETHLSPTMQRIYRRHFDRLSRSVYLLRYYARIARGNAVESSLTKEIIALMDEVNENLKKKIGVAEQILVKSTIKVSKTAFAKVNVTIIDPLANRFLQSINIAQELDQKLSALWLACVLDDEQRTKAIQEIENELQGIQGKCRAISIGLRDRVRAQREPIEPASGINITEAEIKEDEAAELELGAVVESAEKTTTGKKSRKSAIDDGIDVEPNADNTEYIKFSETVGKETAEEIAA
jgi:hypothetical protein